MAYTFNRFRGNGGRPPMIPRRVESVPASWNVYHDTAKVSKYTLFSHPKVDPKAITIGPVPNTTIPSGMLATAMAAFPSGFVAIYDSSRETITLHTRRYPNKNKLLKLNAIPKVFSRTLKNCPETNGPTVESSYTENIDSSES